jgi:uncharacterized protein (DUF1015 family)
MDPDGVHHELWPITDPAQVKAIRTVVESQPVLIADGHHRYETALAYQEERAQQGCKGTDEDAVMALIVELSDEQLTVQPIHRLLQGLPPGFDVLAALQRWFEITPTAGPDRTMPARMAEAEAMAVITPAGAWLARPQLALTSSATYDLDSSRLDAVLSDLPDHQLVYQPRWDQAAAAVTAGQADAAILLRPVAVAQIAAVGRGGVRLPAKTTFFWPKPRTGLVVRELLA